MSKRRDYIEEIFDKRARHVKRIPRVNEAYRRYDSLMDSYYFLRTQAARKSKIQNELYRYFPIALVATLEGYFRRLVKELIDSGEPYESNATKFAKDIRLDLETAAALSRREITLGELIAHQLPHSSRDHILRSLGIVLSEDTETTFRNRLAEEDQPGKDVFAVQLPNCIDYFYGLRHVYCHEIASTTRTRIKEIEAGLKAFKVYTAILEEHVVDHAEASSK